MLIEYQTRLHDGLSLRSILRNVEPSFEQLAKLCGVSRRQLSYWIKNGIVPEPAGDPLLTIERATIIRISMQRGDTLRQAVDRLDESYRLHRANLSALREMSDEERGQKLTLLLEELQVEVNRLRQKLSEPSPSLDPRSIMAMLRNLSLNELLTVLPDSPTPEHIVRLEQSIARVHSALLGLSSVEQP